MRAIPASQSCQVRSVDQISSAAVDWVRPAFLRLALICAGVGFMSIAQIFSCITESLRGARDQSRQIRIRIAHLDRSRIRVDRLALLTHALGPGFDPGRSERSGGLFGELRHGSSDLDLGAFAVAGKSIVIVDDDLLAISRVRAHALSKHSTTDATTDSAEIVADAARSRRADIAIGRHADSARRIVKIVRESNQHFSISLANSPAGGVVSSFAHRGDIKPHTRNPCNMLFYTVLTYKGRQLVAVCGK